MADYPNRISSVYADTNIIDLLQGEHPKFWWE